MSPRSTLVRFLHPKYVLPAGAFLAILGGVGVLAGGAAQGIAHLHRSAALADRADHNEARCLGWCEAHGYDRAFHDGDPSVPFNVAACYCAAPVGSDVALAPIDTETPDSAEEGAPE